jgi:hypothetical protein
MTQASDDRLDGAPPHYLFGWTPQRARYRVFTGDFTDKTGPSQDSDFFYTAIQYTF